VGISEPNGLTDEYGHNNENHSAFELAPQYDHQLIVLFRTNSRPWENSYEIFDTDGNVVFSRGDFEANTLYWDTLSLSPGCYEFMAYDTGGDGMNDWPSGHGNGFIKFMDFDLNVVANPNRWFGEYTRYNFVNTDEPVGMRTIEETASINIFPNPSEGGFTIELLTNPGEYHINVYDLAGKIVYEDKIINSSYEDYQLDLSKFGNGIYLLNVGTADYNAIKKIVIER